MWRDFMYAFAFPCGFPHHMKMTHREIANTSMDQLGRLAGSARGEIVCLDKNGAEASQAGITQNAGTSDTSANQGMNKLL